MAAKKQKPTFVSMNNSPILEMSLNEIRRECEGEVINKVLFFLGNSEEYKDICPVHIYLDYISLTSQDSVPCESDEEPDWNSKEADMVVEVLGSIRFDKHPTKIFKTWLTYDKEHKEFDSMLYKTLICDCDWDKIFPNY